MKEETGGKKTRLKEMECKEGKGGNMSGYWRAIASVCVYMSVCIRARG